MGESTRKWTISVFSCLASKSGPLCNRVTLRLGNPQINAILDEKIGSWEVSFGYLYGGCDGSVATCHPPS